MFSEGEVGQNCIPVINAVTASRKKKVDKYVR